jgi:energy-converting hydrogenase Eha subunit E
MPTVAVHTVSMPTVAFHTLSIPNVAVHTLSIPTVAAALIFLYCNNALVSLLLKERVSQHPLVSLSH